MKQIELTMCMGTWVVIMTSCTKNQQTGQGIENVTVQLKDTPSKVYAIGITHFHQWLFQISMKLPMAKIELGPIYDRLVHKFLFSGLKMRLADL